MDYKYKVDAKPGHIPFLFMKQTDENDAPGTRKYYVMYSWYTYDPYNSDWMGDARLGSSCFIPCVDYYTQEFEFDNETEAMECMRQIWAQVILITD
jgi:hypothetical protein